MGIVGGQAKLGFLLENSASRRPWEQLGTLAGDHPKRKESPQTSFCALIAKCLVI